MIMSGHLDTYTLPSLHLACLKEKVSVVKELIDGGADLNETIACDAPHHHHYSPLQCAIESPYNRKEKVELLLQHGAVVKQRKCICKRKHMTALHLAFYNEYQTIDKDLDRTIVDSLYRVLKDKEENIEDENKLSYFHIAVSRNDFDRVKMYLKRGVKINQSVLRNNRGFSGYTALHFAAHYDLVDMANCLIKRGAKINLGLRKDRQTPLNLAVQKENLEMIQLLIQSGAMVQNLLLHHAVASENPEVVQYLVDSGYDVNAKDDLGQTSLIISLKAESPRKKIIKILLDADAFAHFEDNFGNSALMILDTRAFLSENVDKFEIYKVFLEETVVTEEIRFTDLWLLTSGNETDIKMLLQTNVDLSVTDFYGCSLIHALAKNRNPGVIEQLRDQSFDVDSRDCINLTPLMYAAYYGNFSAVQSLLELGADIEAADDYDQKALNKSLRPGFYEGGKECMLLLLEHGAQFESLEPFPSLFNLVENDDKDLQRKLLLAHLALQEMSGTDITKPIQERIDSCNRSKNYFKYCKQLLPLKIYPSITVFDVLIASQRKLERYLKNEELALKLKELHTVEYYDMMITRRLSKASRLIELRKAAAPIISKIMNTDYNRIPSIVDEILSYFVQKDLEYLISIENQLQLDSCISNNV